MKNVSSKTAKLATKLGFKNKSGMYTYYSKIHKCYYSTTKIGGISGEEDTFKICTQTELQTWLRKQGIEVFVSVDYVGKNHTIKTYIPNIYKNNGVGWNLEKKFNTYEKTMEYTLYNGLKLLQTNK